MLVVVVLHFAAILFFILLLLFFISLLLYVMLFFSLLFNVIPHPSVDYRPVFTSILYFQPSPSQSDSWHFHFQPFRDLRLQFLLRALRFWVVIFYPQVFFILRFFIDILPAFIKAPLGAGSSSLKFAGLHTDWSSKHRRDPSAFFIHSNPQSSYSERFSFKFY